MNLIRSAKSRLLRKLGPYFREFCYKHFGDAFSFFINKQTRSELGNPELFFETSDGRRIPVYPHYRYSIKGGWQYFRPLFLLAQLCRKNLVPEREKEFLKKCIGHRTITMPLEEVEEHLRPIIKKLEHLFIPESLAGEMTPILAPSVDQVKQDIQNLTQAHERMFKMLDRLGVYIAKPGVKVLEIGFISGGYSIFAFEKLGFNPCGVDNQYGGLVKGNPLPDYISGLIDSKAGFFWGDITKKTQFEDESFDIIFSTSVIEHIQDYSGAYREMYRILKPDGVIIHDYGSFYSVNGGHALGILDSPWAHVRLSQKDYLRYIEQLRPFEVEEAKNWILKALNPCLISKMQEYLITAGFNIKLWKGGLGKHGLSGFSPEILKDSFRLNPGITLEDLAYGNIFFVAGKSK